jgi:xanthine dehydrogenase accessory factor
MDWLRAAEHLRQRREAGVLVTLLEVRGHAPRDAGARMVVAAEQQWGTIGGGALEATAVDRARAMLATAAPRPQTMTVPLSPHPTDEHRAQCCGGEVVVALEPLPVAAAVAVFGMGHVGSELARILARHDLDLHLVDSRAGLVGPQSLAPLADPVARLRAHAAADPTAVISALPAGTHVVILTHDHAQDAALCDAALRRDDLGSIGLIGSSAKWRQFQKRLSVQGHAPEALARIRTPIGLPGLAGKEPATIALSVAAELLGIIERRAAAPAATESAPARGRIT